MDIAFYKMHGAGNDFILVDDRGLKFPADDAAWLRELMHRRTGVGSDGLILLQPSHTADFRMRFFNPDGREAEMCGNGARCAARLAAELGIAPPTMRIETMAGTIEAAIQGDRVRLRMTDPKDWRIDRTVQAAGQSWPYGFVNTGVPHVVIRVDRIEEVPVTEVGAAIRRHPDFQPAGTNVNFIEIVNPDTLRIRTYERGVEAETLACGTGIVASALVASRNGWVHPPVRVVTRGGYELMVGFLVENGRYHDVSLEGPAAHVFRGVIRYPGDEPGRSVMK